MYTSLPDPQLSEQLADTDCVSFQPCPHPTAANQDRYLVKDWPMANGTWSFRALLDGHAGHETVDFACEHFPPIVRRNLETYIAAGGPSTSVATLLHQSITSFDHLIVADLFNLFPDPHSLNQFSDNEIRSIINDKGRNSAAVYRCMSGSTLLVSLLDPPRENLWVASLGDSQAVLGYKAADGSWQTQLLSSFHNGGEPSEVERVRKEHPGEPECILNGRVLGAIAVTRAVGDFIFKLPRTYADRVFKNAEPGFNHSARPEEFLRRNLTPPYISNDAHVIHVDLASLRATETHIIMCSDGLLDLYEDNGFELDEMPPKWSDIIARGRKHDGKQNLALLLLRESIGGQDLEKISRTMRVEMCFRWMDDTTILVQRL